MFPITENKETIVDFFDLIKEELSIFEDTEIDIPKEKQLEFHIARIIRKSVIKQEKKLNYKFFMNLGTGFEAIDLIKKKEMSKRARIDITLFYCPKKIVNKIEDDFTSVPFCEVIEIKRSGNIPGRNKKTNEEYELILDKYFAEEYYKSNETNTIAHDFRRLVNFVGGFTNIIRPKYKGEFKSRYKVLGGLFIDLYSEKLKKQVIEYGVKYWKEKKKELEISSNLYLYEITQRINKNKEFLSIIYFTKKVLK